MDLQDTILHLAAKNRDPEAVVLVLEACKGYDRVKEVLCTKNKQGYFPLKVAVMFGNTQSVMLLYSECRKACPHIITEADDGELTLATFHYSCVTLIVFTHLCI